MTWHDRDDESAEMPSWVDVVIAVLFATAYLVWMVSVGLAR